MKEIAYSTLLIIILLLYSCSRKNPEPILTGAEISFKEKLASISQNGNIYYLGAESSGHIYEYSVEKNAVVKTYNIDCGRIYHVKQSLKSHDTLWVGTQNMGLRKVYKHGDSLIVSNVYTISGKDTRYSCYETFIDTIGNRVYAMTSHGIFYVASYSDWLQPVYVEHEKGKTPEPMVAANMVECGNYLYVSTAKGIIRIDRKKGEKDSIILKDRKVNNINYHNGFLYALTDNILFKCSSDGELTDSIFLKRPAKKYYYSCNIHYFLSDNYIVMAQDSNFRNPELYKYVPLHKDLAIKGHNIVADSKDFILMITDKAVLQIGHHLPSVFGEIKEGGAKLACSSGETIYFLVGKKIYKMESGSNTANEVLELKEKGDVRFIECSSDGHSLYFANNHDEIFRCDLDMSWWELWKPSEKYIGKSPKEITAICCSPSVPGLIVGIRDGLICVNEKGEIDTIELYYNDKDVCTIPYISRFAIQRVDSSYMVPTMNDGLFYGKGMRLQLLKDTQDLQFIRDVAYSSDSTKPYILTNKCIYHICKDSILQNNNYSSRILTSDSSFYFPGEIAGVRRIQLDNNGIIASDTILFPDISFKTESSLSLNGSIYLGGSSCVLVLNESNNVSWKSVRFEDSNTPNILLIMCVGLIIILMVVSYDRYRVGKRAILTHKKELIMRIDELKTVDEFLDSDIRLQLENLITEIEGIDVSGRKNALDKIHEISKRIMEQTESIPSLLTQKLVEQKKQMEATCFADVPSYIENSDEAIKVHTILRLGGQLRTNTQWFESASPLLKKYEGYKTIFSGIVSIPNVTDKIIDLLNSDDAHDNVLKGIDEHLNVLNTDMRSKTLLDEYIISQIKKAEDIQSHYEENSDHHLIIKEIIDKYKSLIDSESESVIKIVLAFPLYDKRIRLMEILQTILDNISVFRSRYVKYQELDGRLNSTSTYALLHEDEKNRVKKQDEDARKKTKEEYKRISNEIKEGITDFYNELKKSQDQQLIDGLGLGQKKGKGQFMWENVLALLLSGTDYDYNIYGTILGNDESRIRDAKSDIQNAVENCRTSIAVYVKKHPSSIALLLLNIDNLYKNRRNKDA